jgi:hypothetical protein
MSDHITSVWSSYGHRFMSDGGEATESCLTCGAMYMLVPDESDPTSGRYTTASDGEPAQCTGDTGMAHGYPGERGVGAAAHDCPCLLCDS